MSASTSSNINDSFEKPLPKVRKTVNENTEETNLVTKNLKIFPSLHPLSNHYRVKTDPTSRPAVVRNINSEVEETKKKIKVNDNTEIVVKNESTQSNIPQIPTKPIKIWETKKPVNKIVQDEPLSMDDPLVNMAKALQALQEQQKMQAQRQVFLQRKMMIQQLTQKAAQYTAMLNAIKSQENLLMMNNDSQDLPNFEVNDISTQLIPNITHLMKICQENQQKLFMAVGNQMANQARFQRGMNVNPYGTQSFQFA